MEFVYICHEFSNSGFYFNLYKQSFCCVSQIKIEMTTLCLACRTMKNRDEFTASSLKKGGFQCKACKKKYDRDYQVNVRSKINENVKKLRKIFEPYVSDKAKLNELITKETVIQMYKSRQIDYSKVRSFLQVI